MRKHKGIIISIFLFVVTIAIVIFLVTASHFKTEDSIQIIYIPKTMDESNEFWSALLAGANMAANEFNVKLTLVSPEEEQDYKKQNELIAWAIRQKPDVIALSPADYSQTTAMAREVVKNKIKLVFIDSTVDEKVQDALVATDNFLAGERMGGYMKNYTDKKTKIAIVGHVKNSSTAIEREKGLRKGLGKDEDKIVDVVFCDSSYSKAFKLTEDLLKKYPDINMIAGLNEYSAVGVARAIKSLGLKDRVRVIGFDSSIEEVELLEEGVIRAMVVQKSFNMGYLGIEQAVKLATGEKVDKSVDSGSELITKDNMYTEENQKLLFPFWENQSSKGE
jgi:ABC-type sugar transport system, periplasmic component